MNQFGWEPLSGYPGANVKINFRCLKCGKVDTVPTAYIRSNKHRCKYCKWFPYGIDSWIKKKLGNDYEIIDNNLDCRLTIHDKVGVKHNSKYCNYSTTYKSIRQINRGAGCYYCCKPSATKAISSIKNRLCKRQGDSFELVQYIDNSHPIKIKCNKGHIFETSRACDFRDKHLCKQCWETSKRQYKEQHKRNIQDKNNQSLLDNTKSILAEGYNIVPRLYKDSSNFYIWHQCNSSHRHIFKSSNDKIRYAKSKGKKLCPYCKDKYNLERHIPHIPDNSPLQFISVFKRSNGETMITLGHFDTQGNLLHHSSATNLVWGYKNFVCPACNRLSTGADLTLNQRSIDYKNRINEIYSGRYLVDTSTYVSRKKRVKVKDTRCGHSWYPVARDLLRHETSCTYCNASNGEQKIMDALDELKLNYEFQYKAGCKDQQEMPYDVYVPYYDLLIEYQEEQHYHPVKNLFGGRKKFYTRVRHDYMKKAYARNNDYQLLCIPYTVRTYPQIKHYLQEELKQLDKIKIYKDWLDK